jgi:hypothetical protein
MLLGSFAVTRGDSPVLHKLAVRGHAPPNDTLEVEPDVAVGGSRMRRIADLSPADLPRLPADKTIAWRDAYVAAENARKPALAAFLPAAGIVGIIVFFAPRQRAVVGLLAGILLIAFLPTRSCESHRTIDALRLFKRSLV